MTILRLHGLAGWCQMAPVALVCGLTVLLTTFNVHALPMYAQRSGRTCGNCHISPTWERPEGFANPPVAERKCNMSCMVCHTNPSGGGLRNSSGRYYGQSTLSMFTTQERSYSDKERELIPEKARRWVLNFFRGAGPKEQNGKRIPEDFEEVETGVGSGGTRKNAFVFLKPQGSVSRYAFWDGRYGDLNADPMFQLGADMRFAYWSRSRSAFPMQADLHTSLHPIEHLTFSATTGARGRASGFIGTATQERFPLQVRDAFVMAHELPYMAYVKAGRFLPAFGTYIDDHTSFIRDFFDLNISSGDKSVLGVEAGIAPNYPHFSVSAFKNSSPYAISPKQDPGWGMASNFGWRDLGWSIGGSLMLKKRTLALGGNLRAASINWAFNPFYYSNAIPLTYMGELAIGERQRRLVGSTARFFASYHELWWTIFNGVSLRGKVDVGNRDIEIKDQLQSRYSVALDISPIPGLTFITQARVVHLGFGRTDADVFLQTHIWF